MWEVIKDILSVVGGIGVVLIALLHFLGDIFKSRIAEKDRVNADKAVELHRQQLEARRVQVDLFHKSQFEVYDELWRDLQAVQLSVDSLWKKVTKRGIAALAKQLKALTDNVRNWSYLFEETHYRSLMDLINELERFEAGKVILWDLRDGKNVEYIETDVAEAQIEANGKFKSDFESLLEKLRVSFRDRLSKLEPESE